MAESHSAEILASLPRSLPAMGRRLSLSPGRWRRISGQPAATPTRGNGRPSPSHDIEQAVPSAQFEPDRVAFRTWRIPSCGAPGAARRDTRLMNSPAGRPTLKIGAPPRPGGQTSARDVQG